MKEKIIEIKIKECAFLELDSKDRELVETAKRMALGSYAPYSKFHVGAAIRMENGEIVGGSNQENVAYPSGTCAERTAAYYASARYPGMPMRKIAIAAWTKLHGEKEERPASECFQRKPISPCGACRQALLEYESAYGPIEVILYGLDGVYIFPNVASLLPFCFTEF